MFKVIKQFLNNDRQVNALPNFIIIGAQKSGTLSFYTYLAEHSQLIPSNNKEVHFFDAGLDPDINNYNKGETWYRSHFPCKKNLGAKQKTFEASPLYLFNPDVPKRIFDLIPNIKLIAVLRNPTERAISQYFHERKLGTESLPMMEAFQQEESRLKEVNNTKNYKNFNFIHFTYKSRGVYHTQLDRYFKYFSRDQLLVLNSDDLFERTEETLMRTFKFLEVDSNYQAIDLKPQNISKNRVKVEPDVYEYLDDYFRPHNKKLYDLLGVDFNW